jgi:hypothetical protein
LAALVSTSYLDTQLGSTMTGISQNFYTLNLIASSLTTSSLTFGTGSGYLFLPNSIMNSLSVGILYVSTIVGFTPGGTTIGGGIVSTANLAKLVSTANLANLVSTANLIDLISTSAFDSGLTSTIIGLGTFGYLSSATAGNLPEGLVSTANLANLISTANLIDLVSTSFLDTALGSTLTSLENQFTTNTLLTSFIKNINSINISSVVTTIESDDNYIIGKNGIYLQTSSVVTFERTDGTGTSAAALSSIFFVNTNTSAYGQITTEPTMTNLYWNGSQLNNQSGGGGVSQTDLTSTVIGLGTVGYISTIGPNGVFSTVVTSTLITNSIQSDSFIFIDSYGVVFGKPDGSSYSAIALSSIYIGNGQLTTDTTNNLYWNDSQINSQYGIITLASGRSVTTSDANITTSSIILVTPYGDLGFGNTFWVTLAAATSWDINIASALAGPVDFSYHILKY